MYKYITILGLMLLTGCSDSPFLDLTLGDKDVQETDTEENNTNSKNDNSQDGVQ